MMTGDALLKHLKVYVYFEMLFILGRFRNRAVILSADKGY